MNILDVLIFGFVEGVTEFLPISSTGHLMLTARLLHLAPSEFVKSFQIAIQLGAVLSVAVVYRKQLAGGSRIWKHLLVAFLPAAVIGGFFYAVIKRYLLASSQVVLWSLFLGGLFLVVFEFFYRQKENAVDDLARISYPQALLIGLFQSVAMIPGVSRSAACIVGGLAAGLKRRVVVEFSFLLAIPTMLAATALDLFKSAHSFSGTEFIYLGAGFIVSFLVAMAAIKLLLLFIQKHTFISFGIYRMALAVLFWFFIR
ncbi:MAG: undecaprenyl-diphosphate phosphatase [Candidatus Omnitrophica bacterium]|jgi:undecaprenyl-diphosphatase|nr:undecaprenyl-diphosphate phosphatase [Candidatus Omnitrophota bacterium]